MLGQLSAEEFGRAAANAQASETPVQLRRGNHIRHRSDQPAIKSSPQAFWAVVSERMGPGRASAAGTSAMSLEPAAQARRWLRNTSLKT